MANVVNLNKGNLYKLLALVKSLLMWCMSGVPCIFDCKTCTCDEFICVVHAWCAAGKICACDELICVVCHVWLTVN